MIMHYGHMERLGVAYARIPHGSAPYDCVPGSNRVSLYDDYKTQAYQRGLLDEFGSPINFPRSQQLTSWLKDGNAIEPPFVIKDTMAQKGRGKLLIPDSKAAKRAAEFLHGKSKSKLGALIIEEYIETPSGTNTCYRLTTTPGGTLLAATLQYGTSTAATQMATAKDSGALLAPLVDPKGKYFTNSNRVASNIEQERRYVGLELPSSLTRPSRFTRYELREVDERDAEILESHGIDPQNRMINDDLRQALHYIPRILGASVGVHLGIDLIQCNQTGSLRLLEVNANPEYINLRKSAKDPEEVPDDATIREQAFLQTIDDLASGLFATNPF